MELLCDAESMVNCVYIFYCWITAGTRHLAHFSSTMNANKKYHSWKHLNGNGKRAHFTMKSNSCFFFQRWKIISTNLSFLPISPHKLRNLCWVYWYKSQIYTAQWLRLNQNKQINSIDIQNEFQHKLNVAQWTGLFNPRNWSTKSNWEYF